MAADELCLSLCVFRSSGSGCRIVIETSIVGGVEFGHVGFSYVRFSYVGFCWAHSSFECSVIKLGRKPTQYLLLIYENEQVWASKAAAEQERVIGAHIALGEKLRVDGVPWSGNPLLPTSTAVSVRVRGGVKQITDGPYAETKEQLSG
ncbi:MAG: hypothetical protein FJ194_11210 [Gammaproteobacteria bacterium]|nr:hypothetical protein [Gammaproteobacteria bacterium]